MELLIIFIIMMVLSSILRSFRSSGRTYTPPAPRPQRPEIPLPPELFNIPEEEVKETPPGELYLPEWPELHYGREAEALTMEVPGREEEHPLNLRKKPLMQVSLPQKSPKTKKVQEPVPDGARARGEEERDMGISLHELLSGNKLPLGIIAAEVFSAPRARRPFKNPRF